MPKSKTKRNKKYTPPVKKNVVKLDSKDIFSDGSPSTAQKVVEVFPE